jgi:hypothetical protein
MSISFENFSRVQYILGSYIRYKKFIIKLIKPYLYKDNQDVFLHRDCIIKELKNYKEDYILLHVKNLINIEKIIGSNINCIDFSLYITPKEDFILAVYLKKFISCDNYIKELDILETMINIEALSNVKTNYKFNHNNKIYKL